MSQPRRSCKPRTQAMGLSLTRHDVAWARDATEWNRFSPSPTGVDQLVDGLG
jgi:hypothetical protein